LHFVIVLIASAAAAAAAAVHVVYVQAAYQWLVACKITYTHGADTFHDTRFGIQQTQLPLITLRQFIL